MTTPIASPTADGSSGDPQSKTWNTYLDFALENEVTSLEENFKDDEQFVESLYV